jgi:hypothetical protein
MKKSYATATLVKSGSLLYETLGPVPGGTEATGQFQEAGSVGFYL